MVYYQQKGISTLASLDDLRFICEPIPDNQSGSFHPDTMQTPHQFTDSESITNLATAYSTEVVVDDDTAYSYVPRRPVFVETLDNFRDIYPKMFFVQIQDEIVTPFHPASFDTTPVIIYDNNFDVVPPPSIKEIISHPSRNDIVVFGDENHKLGFAIQDKSYQYNFNWSRHEGQDGNEIWLEIRRLNEPGNLLGEVYYHLIFDDKMNFVTHTDSHFFRYNEEAYNTRINTNERAPLIKVEMGGQMVPSKFYHFSSEMNDNNPFLAGDGVFLAQGFFNDPRVEKYLSNVLDQLKG